MNKEIIVRQSKNRRFANFKALWQIFWTTLFAEQIRVHIIFNDELFGRFTEKTDWMPIVGFKGRYRRHEVCFRMVQWGRIVETCLKYRSSELGDNYGIREIKASANIDIPSKVYNIHRRNGEWLPVLPYHPYPDRSFTYKLVISSVEY
jgi:hypothetical protein